jgi:hypothetical protein
MRFLFAMTANVLVYRGYSSIVVFSVPDEGYSSIVVFSVPDEGYSSIVVFSVSDEGYSSIVVFSMPDEGYSSIVVFSVPDEGYSRNTSCSLNLMSTLLLIFKVIQCSKHYCLSYYRMEKINSPRTDGCVHRSSLTPSRFIEVPMPSQTVMRSCMYTFLCVLVA